MCAPAAEPPPSQPTAPPRRLEFKLTHESLSAMDEKKLREQKERLERTERPNAVRASALSARLDAIKAESNELRAQIAEIDKKVRPRTPACLGRARAGGWAERATCRTGWGQAGGEWGDAPRLVRRHRRRASVSAHELAAASRGPS